MSSPKTALKFGLLLVASALPFLPNGDQTFDELVRDGQLYLDPDTMAPFTGVGVAGNLRDGPFEDLMGQRRPSSKETYVDGVRHGPYERYFESGAIFETGTYVDVHLDGPYRAFWEAGDLYEGGTYRRGHFDGPRRWFMGGHLVETVTYRNGIIEGIYERYTASGELDMKGILYDGYPCGRWIEGTQVIEYIACGARVTE